jgi:hypothetical protein
MLIDVSSPRCLQRHVPLSDKHSYLCSLLRTGESQILSPAASWNNPFLPKNPCFVMVCLMGRRERNTNNLCRLLEGVVTGGERLR